MITRNMRLGNKLIFILFCLIYFFSYSFAEDKITTTPLINLEKIKPSFEETDEKNDFDFESKPEVIKFRTEDGRVEEEWTGNYVFENEWQSFRQNNRNIKLIRICSISIDFLSFKIAFVVMFCYSFGAVRTASG